MESPGQRAIRLAYQDSVDPSRHERIRRRMRLPIQVKPEGFKLDDVLSDFVRMMKAADVIDGKQQDKMLRYIQSAETKAVPTGHWSKKSR